MLITRRDALRIMAGGTLLGPVDTVSAQSFDMRAQLGGYWNLRSWGALPGRGRAPSELERNRIALQSAIDHVARCKGGWLIIDDFFEVDRGVLLQPKVSIEMSGGGLINPTEEIVSYGYGQILIPGNFHPDFTSKFIYYPVVTPAYVTRRLIIIGQGGRFSPGDQVFIASQAGGTSTGFLLPHFAWLNVVDDVEGDAVTFRHPVDVPGIALGVARLADETCRHGEPAFFWQDGEIRGGVLETAVWHWSSDTATLDCKFTGITSRSAAAIYGNTFQRTQWTGCNFFFRNSIGEQSHNSLDTLAENCQFIFSGAPGTNANGPSLQEAARRVTYRNFLMDFGDAAPSGQLLRTIDARDTLFEDGDIIGRGHAGLSAIHLGSAEYPGNITAAFRANDNVVRRVRMSVPCARYAQIGTSEFSIGQKIEDCDFSGELSTNQAIRLNAGVTTQASNKALILRHNRIAQGGLSLEGIGNANARVDVIDSGVSE